MATKTVEEYKKTLKGEPLVVWEKLRKIIKDEVSGCDEVISYGIPAIKKQGKIVLYFSAWKSHASVYPIPPANATLQKQLLPHIKGKGTLQFSFDKELPSVLIKKIVHAHLARLDKKNSLK